MCVCVCVCVFDSYYHIIKQELMNVNITVQSDWGGQVRVGGWGRRGHQAGILFTVSCSACAITITLSS